MVPNVLVSAPPAARPPGALPTLRAATRSHHERLDRLIELRRLRDAQRYGRLLQAMDGFLHAWEACAGAALPPAWQAWLHRRSRRPFLQQDLRVLGLAGGTPPLALPVLAGSAQAWGSVYVMEGSALGAQVITRSLAAEGLSPERGGAYFHGWGTATGGMWHEARRLLDEQLADPAHLAQACEGACATFDALAHHLETALHERPSPA